MAHRHRVARAMTEAEQERARVVAWLRDDAGRARADLSRLHARQKLTIAQTAEWEILIQMKVGIANAIARGDHLKGVE